MKRRPDCHPDRRHEGRGLCTECYMRAHHRGAIADYERTSRSREDFLEDYRLLRAQGYSRAQIAERLGVTRDAVDKAVSRARRAGVEVTA